MHVHLLENPSAGRGKTRVYLDAVGRALEARGHTLTVYRGGAPGDLALHVAGLDDDACDRLAVAGGDGTLRLVVDAMVEPLSVPVGLLPTGTANLVARETGLFPLPRPEVMARVLTDAEPWNVDLLELRRAGARPERALAVVSAGLDAELVHAVERARDRRSASGGYAKWAFGMVPALTGYAFPPIDVAVDGAPPRRCTTVVVQNATSYGGLFRLAPDAQLDSGALEVVRVSARSPLDAVRLLVAAGTGQAPRDRQVRVERGRHVSIRAARRVPVQVDGDPAGHTDLEVELIPRALRLLRLVPNR